MAIKDTDKDPKDPSATLGYQIKVLKMEKKLTNRKKTVIPMTIGATNETSKVSNCKTWNLCSQKTWSAEI